MTHVFIVNEQTFNIHLQYLFAGTGYKDKDLYKILSANNLKEEKTIVSMIADISKVRTGDKILFYVTGCKKIFGIFEIAGDPFYEPVSPAHYLYKELKKHLIFRVKIKPWIVYPEGLSEHCILDEIKDINHPYEMCWSLIYRKLSGMRGCAFVTDYEFHRIESLLKAKNKKPLCAAAYQYDRINQAIVPKDLPEVYSGDISKKIDTDIYDRLFHLNFVMKKSYETHLQAYITENHDKSPLDQFLWTKHAVRKWIGNEVVCSVGEQRIDILTICETDTSVDIRVVELKDETPSEEIIKSQIPWYIHWVDQYLSPTFSNKTVRIFPVIIAKRFTKNTEKKEMFFDSMVQFNKVPPTATYSQVQKLEYVSFSLDETSKKMTFQKE